MNLFTLRDILMMKYQSTPEKRFLPGYTKVSQDLAYAEMYPGPYWVMASMLRLNGVY